jgi:hypothetical protein
MGGALPSVSPAAGHLLTSPPNRSEMDEHNASFAPFTPTAAAADVHRADAAGSDLEETLI